MFVETEISPVEAIIGAIPVACAVCSGTVICLVIPAPTDTGCNADKLTSLLILNSCQLLGNSTVAVLSDEGLSPALN